MARLITDYDVSAAYGLATDEALMGSTSLHLYTYAGAALVGRYQDLRANIDIEWCRKNGFDYNRRLTGGGGIVMTPDQLGMALTLNRETHDLPRDTTALFRHFGAAVRAGLANLGITAQFVPKNDLVVDGQKIAGLGLWQRSQEIQFHCSLLVDMDFELMRQALHLTTTKLEDKTMDSFADRITTVRDHVTVDLETVVAAMKEGFSQTLSRPFTMDSLTAAEHDRIDRMVTDRYGTDDWRFLINAETEYRQAAIKTDGGLLRVYAKVADETLAEIRITGDFFAQQETITAIESTLKWTPLDRAALVENIAMAPSIEGITDEELVTAIVDASRSRSPENNSV